MNEKCLTVTINVSFTGARNTAAVVLKKFTEFIDEVKDIPTVVVNGFALDTETPVKGDVEDE